MTLDQIIELGPEETIRVKHFSVSKIMATHDALSSFDAKELLNRMGDSMLRDLGRLICQDLLTNGPGHVRLIFTKHEIPESLSRNFVLRAYLSRFGKSSNG